MEDENIDVLYSQEQIQKRLQELAKQLDEDYQGKTVTVLCVMRGACFFAVELTLKMKTDIRYEFIEISSYGKETSSSGKVTLRTNIRDSLKGKDVLIVEDIIDSGRSMTYLLEHLKQYEPNSVKVCVLADKKGRREFEVPIDYVAFEIPNRFVVGYGFDAGEKYRNLPYIGALKED